MSGELPAGTVTRAAGTWPGGTWGSALTCREFTAVRGVGFEPVGQVFGAAVLPPATPAGIAVPGRGVHPATGGLQGRPPRFQGGAMRGRSGRWWRPCTRPGRRPSTG